MLQVKRVGDRGRRGFGQAVSLGDWLTGHFLPLLGYRLLHGHATADRQAQAAEVDFRKTRRVQQRCEHGVDTGNISELVALELLDESRQVARVGDQYVFTTLVHHRQAITL